MRAWQVVGPRKLACYAEIGIWNGDTTDKVIAEMPEGGVVHLFDYEDVVDRIADKLEAKWKTKVRIVRHGNSRKDKDSYNWSLMKLIRDRSDEFNGQDKGFDFVYLDGAHAFETDALAFYLIDRTLKVGGFLEFDDYTWNHRVSMDNHQKTMADQAKRLHEEYFTSRFTDEQLATPNIALVVDLLVKPMPNYQEIHPDRVFRKTDVLVPRATRIVRQ